MIRKVVIVIIILASFGIFYGLGRQIYDTLQSGKRLDDEASTVTSLQEKNSELKKRLSETQTTEFIERQARDKLNLARPNETIVIIPEAELQKVLGAEKKEDQGSILPNWLGWLKVFF